MFKSHCRICKRTMSGTGWPEVNLLHANTSGVLEECIPSNNLEYLEWLYNKKNESSSL